MSGGQVFHIELRQFPHNLCRFNLTEHELRATIVDPWAQEQWIELGERKWSPHQAKLTVLEGPLLPVEQLSLGRGWRAAQRKGTEVTERVLAAARAGAEARVQVGATVATQMSRSGDEGLLADSLGLELLSQLGSGPVSLRRVWELARVRHPECTPGQGLVLAERAVGSLLSARLIALVWQDGGEHTRGPVAEAEIQAVLRAADSWTGEIVGVARR